jgi:DNA repair protein RecO (recombination protein O)
MDWTEDAIVLAARRHGESAAIVALLTRGHGRYAGLVRGGWGRRARGLYLPGNRVSATWRARLAEHLGSLVCEPLESAAARFLEDPARLAALSAAAALCEACLPEREPHPAAYDGFLALVEALAGAAWAEAYVLWELGLLAELGYGLDLGRCAATGLNDELAFVSPRTGRAVSLSAGAPYRDRLLPLPGFLVGRNGGGPDDVIAGLRTTGHFLERHVFQPRNRGLPPARDRLVERLARAARVTAGAAGA